MVAIGWKISSKARLTMTLLVTEATGAVRVLGAELKVPIIGPAPEDLMLVMIDPLVCEVWVLGLGRICAVSERLEAVDIEILAVLRRCRRSKHIQKGRK